MKTMQNLIQEIAHDDVLVTDVEIVQTEFGEIIRVHAQATRHPNVLAFTVDLPSEIVSEYDLQDAGSAWKEGWKRIGK